MDQGHADHPKDEHKEESHDNHGHGEKKISPGIAIFVVAIIIVVVFLIVSGKLF